MFKEWGFLLTEIWFLLAMAGLIGLFAGWIIWARNENTGAGTGTGTGAGADDAETGRLRAALAACQANGDALTARISDLDARLAARPVLHGPQAMVGGAAATRPVALTAPRAGVADDLKLIKGVGPKLETVCNTLGFYHFDQIASWTAAEVAWVDDNLEGFKGRVSRDDWINQARDLAAGKPPRAGGEN